MVAIFLAKGYELCYQPHLLVSAKDLIRGQFTLDLL